MRQYIDPRALPDLPLPRDRRAALASDPRLAPYAQSTTQQLLGLLDAVSNYVVRIFPGDPPAFAPGFPLSPEALQAHRRLVHVWTELAGSGGKTGHAALPAFSADLQEGLQCHKYLSPLRGVAWPDLCALLEAIAEYSIVAPIYPLLTKTGSLTALQVVGFNRCLHAHNAMVSFHTDPFTLAAFEHDVRVSVLPFFP